MRFLQRSLRSVEMLADSDFIFAMPVVKKYVAVLAVYF